MPALKFTKCIHLLNVLPCSLCSWFPRSHIQNSIPGPELVGSSFSLLRRSQEFVEPSLTHAHTQKSGWFGIHTHTRWMEEKEEDADASDGEERALFFLGAYNALLLCFLLPFASPHTNTQISSKHGDWQFFSRRGRGK